ncbi:MAG: hypothetical protein ABIL70_05055 [candidate division WOR-3 bacterium]
MIYQLLYITLNFSFNAVSTLENAHSSSNPAFTSYLSNYELYLAHKDLGEINYFNFSTRLRKIGIGFSSSTKEDINTIEKKTWISNSFHFNLPVSLGTNCGIIKNSNQIGALFDFGIWVRYFLNIGICYYNLFAEERSLRTGISYPYRAFEATIELQSKFQTREIITHFLLDFKKQLGRVQLGMGFGYHPKRFVSKYEITLNDFINCTLYLEEEPSLILKIYFSPPVIVKEVTVVETLMVEKPLVVKKTKKYELTQEKLNYCEMHYRAGIEYYLKNELKKAIQEWNLVVNVYPEYKDVARYLDTAKKKLALLEEK